MTPIGPDSQLDAPSERDEVGSTVRVLIVDDHAAFRALARELLQLHGFDVVGEACDGRSALDQTRRLVPGLVLLDIGLPDADGFAVAEQIASLEPAPMVVLISSRDSSVYRRRLNSSGVRGFLVKDELTAASLTALVR